MTHHSAALTRAVGWPLFERPLFNRIREEQEELCREGRGQLVYPSSLKLGEADLLETAARAKGAKSVASASGAVVSEAQNQSCARAPAAAAATTASAAARARTPPRRGSPTTRPPIWR